MQTFLPYPNIIKSVQCLDNKRLGKQRVEALQILKALTYPNYGWKNHPAVKMWRGYERYLEYYMNMCILYWKQRGFRNSMLLCLSTELINVNTISLAFTEPEDNKPIWFGNKNFHDSHKSNLLRKMPEYYSQFNWDVPNNLPYIWPV